MFGSGLDSGHPDDSGTVLLPTRFVWPYGGRRVFLSGTFTRWSDHVPMSPMEGCPTVFQVVYNLTPGYHQYKFFVDGEWRHDEHRPFVNGNYGVVNTIFLAREPDMIPQFPSPETPGRGGANMEVDGDPFSRAEVVPKIMQADIEISRHRISAFLSTHTAYELLPDSGKVIALDVTLPVKQAFHILYEQGVSVAPLWDYGKGQFVGILSPLDFILILRELGNHGPNMTEEELETHAISTWKEGKLHLKRQIDGNGTLYSKRLIEVFPALRGKVDASLLTELWRMWTNYKAMAKCLQGFFLYLDRHFAHGKLVASLSEVSIHCFRDLVCNCFCQNFLEAAISLISLDREGKSVDRELLKNVATFFIEIGEQGNKHYYDSFENAILANTEDYHHNLASQWLSCYSSAEYFLKAEWCLNQEKGRFGQYLHESSLEKLLQVVHWQLLGQTASILSEKQKAESNHGLPSYQELLSGCASLSLGDRCS